MGYLQGDEIVRYSSYPSDKAMQMSLHIIRAWYLDTVSYAVTPLSLTSKEQHVCQQGRSFVKAYVMVVIVVE